MKSTKSLRQDIFHFRVERRRAVGRDMENVLVFVDTLQDSTRNQQNEKKYPEHSGACAVRTTAYTHVARRSERALLPVGMLYRWCAFSPWFVFPCLAPGYWARFSVNQHAFRQRQRKGKGGLVARRLDHRVGPWSRRKKVGPCTGHTTERSGACVRSSLFVRAVDYCRTWCWIFLLL